MLVIIMNAQKQRERIIFTLNVRIKNSEQTDVPYLCADVTSCLFPAKPYELKYNINRPAGCSNRER